MRDTRYGIHPASRIAYPGSRSFRAAICAGLLAAACATLPPPGAPRDDLLRARVEAILEYRELGSDALSVIDNVIRHAAAPPPTAPPIVRELLAAPLAAADAQTLFYRTVPGTLRRLAGDLSAEPRSADAPGEAPVSLRELLDAYLGGLAGAQRMLRLAARGAPVDGQALILQLRDNLPSSGRLGAVAAGVDQSALDNATWMFLNSTARFIRALRAAGGRLQFPERAVRFESAIGTVVIGTRGDDVHGPDAAVIVDPGGNDQYRRSPTTGGAVSVIVDLGGDDRYLGSDVAVHGLSAIVDFSGSDIYAMAGPGLGAAIAGVAIVVDLAGDDSYSAELFGEGAAAHGLGAVVDLAGNDTYRLRAGGQGLGLAGGVGLLWDRGGNDTYTAAGLADVYARGGGLSWAQGAGFGSRTSIGGGIGVLRDESGDDRYQAEMYAQGAGYYYALGLLWDGGGSDRYHAVRYAQGAGVHEAVGVLRDESGDDRYELAVGVGQGMGLDLAVGLLFDGAGDDRYRAPLLAQGAATANGLGVLVDGGGADRWHVDDVEGTWGRAEWARGLPTLGVLVHDPARAVFTHKDAELAAPSDAAAAGGPLSGLPARHVAPAGPRCPEATSAAGETGLPLAQLLRRLSPAFAGAPFDPAIYGEARRRLTARLEASLEELPRDDFDVALSLAEALRCAVTAATAEEAAALWNAMERALAAQTPFAGAVMAGLGERPAPAPQMARMLTALDAYPACGVRAAALRLRADTATDEGSRAAAARAAQSALKSSCWRLQAAALAVLRQLGAAPDPGATLPTFLRRNPAAP
jgi:hypothetical protein